MELSPGLRPDSHVVGWLSRKRSAEIAEDVSAKRASIEFSLLPDLWSYISSYLWFPDLRRMRLVCRRFRTLGEARRRVQRIYHCFGDGWICAQLAITKDDLETYQLLEDLSGGTLDEDLAHAISHKASRCFEYLWLKVKHPSALMEHFSDDRDDQKSERDPIFDQRVLGQMMDTGYKIDNKFLYSLNCSVEIKIELLKSMNMESKQKYLKRCVVNLDELEVVRYLLEENVLINIRQLYIMTGNDLLLPRYEQMKELLAKNGYIIPILRPSKKSTSPSCEGKDKHDLSVLFPILTDDPRLAEWRSFSETCFSIWHRIRRIWNLFPEHREMFSRSSSFANLLPFYAVPKVIGGISSLLTNGTCDPAIFPELYRYYSEWSNDDLSFFHILWKTGGQAYLRRVFEGAFWTLDISIWVNLYNAKLSVHTTFENVKKLVEWYRADTATAATFFFIVQYFASIAMPRFLEMLIELDLDYVWLYLAYWCGCSTSSPDVVTEAKRVQNEKLLLFQARIVDYDGSCLAYLRHRCSIRKCKDPGQIVILEKLFGKSFPVA